MQPSRNFDDLKFSSIHRRILLWGSGGPFLDGYVLVMIGVALEQLTPALKLDADWIGFHRRNLWGVDISGNSNNRRQRNA